MHTATNICKRKKEICLAEQNGFNLTLYGAWRKVWSHWDVNHRAYVIGAMYNACTRYGLIPSPHSTCSMGMRLLHIHCKYMYNLTEVDMDWGTHFHGVYVTITVVWYSTWQENIYTWNHHQLSSLTKDKARQTRSIVSHQPLSRFACGLAVIIH